MIEIRNYQLYTEIKPNDFLFSNNSTRKEPYIEFYVPIDCDENKNSKFNQDNNRNSLDNKIEELAYEFISSKDFEGRIIGYKKEEDFKDVNDKFETVGYIIKVTLELHKCEVYLPKVEDLH